MHPTQAATDAEPPEDGGDDECERVRRVLARAGFDTSTPTEDGLRVWTAAEGVMVGWVAREVLRPTVQIHGHEDDIGRLTSLTGLHQALRTALAVILREAGLDASVHGEHLVVVRPADTGQDPASASRGRTP
ncbi:hypothetical protein ABZY83_17285 [Streptomyces virginiae]|uniref:hypothetical protein n=1 Tax=Streptomyces TaxID=1883 RepID=UPI0006AE02F4|nr:MULTISPECIES: hypothetical protein [unclassified Streptomyces]KOU65277.1 hypothetical protein ADK96_17915 [Streptomyces sp. IGB124]KOU79146.1 hypothetical protein ADK61_11765 [Streptomyces sp. XY66]KOU82375.1 hypothetical protein ADK93_29055 [Streptomyces sp. XY58]KOV03951.1 hypothetical protein ADK89_25075 [Streptomyces sp. XY37]KOV32531.1 hypothetical protein ADK97_21990 [Streptomyces sp. H021]